VNPNNWTIEVWRPDLNKWFKVPSSTDVDHSRAAGIVQALMVGSPEFEIRVISQANMKPVNDFFEWLETYKVILLR